MPARKEDPRLTRLSAVCAGFPEVTREIHGSHATFRIRKKPFCYYMDNHHGDGIVSVSCKVFPGDNTALVSAQPKRFYLPAYVGPRGWVALRLDLGQIDWDEVKELVSASYRLLAPQKLVQATDAHR